MKNHSIESLHKMLLNINHEMTNCVSAGLSHVTVFDLTRFRSWIDEIAAYHIYLKAMGTKDRPHAANLDIPMAEMPAMPDTENVSLNECLRKLRIADVELLKSQSKDLIQGLIVFDSARLDDIIAEFRALFDFIADNTPTDRPESAASEA